MDTDTPPATRTVEATTPPAVYTPPEPTPLRRRGAVAVTALAVLVLGGELLLGWPSLVAALGQLRTPHVGWLLAAFAAEIASMGLYARMQRRLLRSAGTRVQLTRHVALAYAAHSLSVTLPGGPVFSTSFNFRQMRHFGASPAVASWCIALSGALSSGALVLIGAAGGLLARTSGSWRALLCDVAAAVLIALGVRLLARHPQWLARPVSRLLARADRAGLRAGRYRTQHLVSFLDQLRTVRIRPADFTVAGLLAVANWLLDAACLWMCCVAVHANHIGVVELVIAYCAGMAAASIPIIPGGLGTIDGALVLGLVTGGLTASGAIAAVVLYRMITFGFIVGAGWIVWLFIRYAQRRRPAPRGPAARRAPRPRPGRRPVPPTRRRRCAPRVPRTRPPGTG